ncbi:hypothetical protein [Cohnella thermotolerans]|jgi:hypothetical protein|uniref:hypothetical protein n=1 Tax=Cohnella thermotolerans TaxID=329858 RepID=UPI000413BE81|nr:hypothetical protein [Cohnella thermotolerans]
MSKLDGNERWKSKMLLTEHQEQYEARKEGRPAGRPTPDELTMIRDYILLPHMLTIVHKRTEEMRNSSDLMKRPFLAAAEAIVKRISQDMYKMRRELSRRRIRIVGDEQVDLVVYHRFICRGYEDRLGIVREVMRAEISLRLAKYFGEIVRWIGQYEGPELRPDRDAGADGNKGG